MQEQLSLPKLAGKRAATRAFLFGALTWIVFHEAGHLAILSV
jgi:hypothetical protein